MDPQTEGRLLALRRIMALIAAGRSPEEILDRCGAITADGEEDPGVLPHEEFAVQQAMAEEKDRFAKDLKSLLEARDR